MSILLIALGIWLVFCGIDCVNKGLGNSNDNPFSTPDDS